MNDFAIHVEGLSKRYRIGKAQQRHDTLRDALMAGMCVPLDWLREGGPGAGRASRDTIWALKDVSFDVRRGEVLGIIGSNGAGKSTLLKVLSRITEPTEDRAILHGRVGSLLEVGTGFHPELSGRENIYLSGAILGMRRTEINRKFDEIVAFAELNKFLDTPVKRYSSGMYVRLAFAVAAHLDPEILLVDEVLAVGDAAFQRKCLGKMRDTAEGGRTVLFVSHSMKAVSSLCSKGILLDGGEVRLSGPVHEVIQAYLRGISSGLTHGERSFEPTATAPVFVSSLRTVDANGIARRSFPRSEPVVLIIKGHVSSTTDNLHIAIDLRSIEDELLFRTHSFESEDSFANLAKNVMVNRTLNVLSDLRTMVSYGHDYQTHVFSRDNCAAAQTVVPDLGRDRQCETGLSYSPR
jgi:lipopolysaccharide transport system ATP-binding protein